MCGSRSPVKSPHSLRRRPTNSRGVLAFYAARSLTTTGPSENGILIIHINIAGNGDITIIVIKYIFFFFLQSEIFTHC